MEGEQEAPESNMESVTGEMDGMSASGETVSEEPSGDINDVEVKTENGGGSPDTGIRTAAEAESAPGSVGSEKTQERPAVRPSNGARRSYGSGRGRSDSQRSGQGNSGQRQRRGYFRKKVCRLCVNKIKTVDYKDVDLLKRFVTDRGKILPRRMTGTCAKHQRVLSAAVKRARMAALLPFVKK